jgi:Recombinase
VVKGEVVVNKGKGKGKMRTPVKVVADYDEAELVRDAAKRLLAGETGLETLAAEWNAKGVKGVKGGDIQASSIKLILLSPTVAGLRREGGIYTVVKKRKRLADGTFRPVVKVRNTEGKLVQGNWDGILDRETWNALQEWALDRADTNKNTGPNKGGRGNVSHMLVGIARCGALLNDGTVCDSRMAYSTSPGKRGANGVRAQEGRYWCRKNNGGMRGSKACGKQSIKATVVENETKRQVLSRLPGLAAATTDAVASNPWVAIADLKKQIAALDADVRDGVIEYTDAQPIRRGMDDRRKALVAVAEASKSAQPVYDVALAADPEDAFDNADVATQQIVIRSVLTKVVVLPSKAGQLPGDRVKLIWKE